MITNKKKKKKKKALEREGDRWRVQDRRGVDDEYIGIHLAPIQLWFMNGNGRRDADANQG